MTHFFFFNTLPIILEAYFVEAILGKPLSRPWGQKDLFKPKAKTSCVLEARPHLGHQGGSRGSICPSPAGQNCGISHSLNERLRLGESPERTLKIRSLSPPLLLQRRLTPSMVCNGSLDGSNSHTESYFFSLSQFPLVKLDSIPQLIETF